MRFTLVFTCMALAGLTACNEPLGRQLFKANVAPILKETCAPCHLNARPGVPEFLGIDNSPDGYYKALTEKGYIEPFSVSRLYLKGEHNGGAARDFTELERSAGRAWLDQEKRDRSKSTPPDTFAQGKKAFVSCMNFNDWTLARMAEVGHTSLGTLGGSCVSCHQYGLGGVTFSVSDDETFRWYRDIARVHYLVEAKTTDGKFDGLKPAERFVSAGLPPLPTVGHNYILSVDAKNAIERFFALTMTRVEGGFCVPGNDLPDAGPDLAPVVDMSTADAADGGI